MVFMTKIEFLQDKKSNILGYVMEGHTGYDEYGKDIVCAAVSVLAQTGVISLQKNLNLDNLTCVIKDGYIQVQLPKKINDDDFKNAQIVLKTVLIGIKSIMESYSGYITLKYREV